MKPAAEVSRAWRRHDKTLEREETGRAGSRSNIRKGDEGRLLVRRHYFVLSAYRGGGGSAVAAGRFTET
jgi:hypothetical protein